MKLELEVEVIKDRLERYDPVFRKYLEVLNLISE